MKTDNVRIPLDLSVEEFRLVHDAIMERPYGAVERLVAKLRQAAAAAMQEAQRAAKKQEPTP